MIKNRGFTQVFLEKSLANSQCHNHESYAFTSVGDLIDFVTQRWQEHWVLKNVADEHLLDALSRRPFFLLVSVDAPVGLRWKRFRERYDCNRLASGLLGFLLFFRCLLREEISPDWGNFVARSDDYLYGAPHGLASLMNQAEVKLINSTSSLERLHNALDKLDLLDQERLRPSWDQYFMQLASLAAQRSNCMKRRVGCVIVRERRVISTGYNGTPRDLQNCNEGGCRYLFMYSGKSNADNVRRQ